MRKLLTAFAIGLTLTTASIPQPSHALGGAITVAVGQGLAGGIIMAVGGTAMTGGAIAMAIGDLGPVVIGFFVFVGGAVLLPGQSAVEFRPLENYEAYGLTRAQAERYNDHVPGLNARAREITHELFEIVEEESLSPEEASKVAKELWDTEFDRLGVNASDRWVLRTIIDQTYD